MLTVSTIEIDMPMAVKVSVSEDTLSVDLRDGRSILVPLAWYPRLASGSAKERENWRLIGQGAGIHWEDLDEDISLLGLLEGRPSGESQDSFQRWLATKHGSRESIRNTFRPTRIKILFVGESPPANGDFFYVHSQMTNYMAEVFCQVYNKNFKSSEDFLKFFKAESCYLDDMSYEPVDNLPRSKRRQKVKDCVGAFAKRLREFKPQHVIVLLKSIEDQVRDGVEASEIDVSVDVVPFPGQSHQREFVEQLSAVLNRIREQVISSDKWAS